MTAEVRLRAVKTTIALAWVCGLALSWRLWTASRLFPLAPISDALPSLDPPLDVIGFGTLIALLLATAIRPGSRVILIAALAFAVPLALLDQTRWQPWLYQYVVMLAACARLRPERALDACRAIVALTYLWSGLQKLNATFVQETWPEFARAVVTVVPAASRLPPAFVLMIPAVEILTGVGLLTRRFRTPALAVALITHATILTLLLSSRENTVVWPWNAAMVVFVGLLFWRERDASARDLLLPRPALQRAVVLLFGVLPALSFAGLWDSYLSAALYSGNTHQAVIYMNPSTIQTLPRAIHSHIWRRTEPFFLDINRWAYGELNVPAYPEPRVYRVVAERVCQWGDDAIDIKLLIFAKPNPLTGARASELYDCDHLREIH
jgi:hypothetical protein